jgi:hypothetical protein
LKKVQKRSNLHGASEPWVLKLMEIPQLDALLGKIRHGDDVERIEAAKVLAEIESEHVIAGLSSVLRAGRQRASREAAAYALSWHKSPEAISPLLECAADPDEQDRVRGQAIEGMAIHLSDVEETELRRKVEDLMISLLESPSPVLRFWSCYGLGALACKRAVPLLRNLSAHDREVCPGWWHVREEAEDALEWIAGRPGKDRVPVHLRHSHPPRS